MGHRWASVYQDRMQALVNDIVERAGGGAVITEAVQLDGVGSAMAVAVPRCEESGRSRPSGGQYYRWSATILVGIENEREFMVGRRIIGTKGANMKAIVSQVGAGTMIRLRGVGSQHLEVTSQTGERAELQEPLQVRAKAGNKCRKQTCCQIR